MSKRPVLNYFVLAAALAIGAGPYVVRAAGSPSPRAAAADPSPVAIVDMQRVFAESSARVQAEERVRAFGMKAGKNFDDIANMRFVTPEETSDLSVALNADKPTAAQIARIEELRKANTAREQEYQQLSTTALPSVQQKARLGELTRMLQSRPAVMERLKAIYQGAVDEEETKQNRLGFTEVRSAVQKLAKDQGFTQVFDVTALVYAPSDLTEQAIKKVKK